MPGHYTVRLTVDGKHYTQPLTVRMDPRVKTSHADLSRQFALSKRAYDDAVAGLKALGEIRAVQRQLAAHKDAASNAATAAYAKQLKAIAGPQPSGPYFFYGYDGPPTLASVAWSLRRLMGEIQAADRAPTAAEVAAADQTSLSMRNLIARWHSLRGHSLAAVNAALRRSRQPALTLLADAPVPDGWDRPWVKRYKADE
jgi:hypothetical protein